MKKYKVEVFEGGRKVHTEFLDTKNQVETFCLIAMLEQPRNWDYDLPKRFCKITEQ